jgi:TetR/AcrR family transcriptional regulator
MAAWANAVPSRSQQADLKRTSILREAARSFNRSGFHGTTLDEIAERLGVTKAALYRYVPNKHELLFACFTLAADAAFANLDAGEAQGRNGLEKVRIGLQGYVRDMIGEFGFPVVLLEENALLPEHAKIIINLRDRVERRLRALVALGIEDGSIAPCNPKLVSFAIFGAVNWVPKWYRAGGDWSAEEVAEWLLAVVTRSIAAEPHRIDIDGPRANSRGATKKSGVGRKTTRRAAGK